MYDGPLVSVVVPVYNGERFLSEALDSIFAQTYRPIEVIVVDDGSTDNSVEIARSYREVIIDTQPHAGVSAARNRGMNVASAELITFIDMDDEMTPGGLTSLVEYIESNPRVGCVFGHSTVRFEPGVEAPEWLQMPIGHEHPVPMAGALFRTALLREAGGFDERLTHGEFFDLFTRLHDPDLQVGVIDESVLRYRVHTQNKSYQEQLLRQGMFRSLKNRMDRNAEQGSENK